MQIILNGKPTEVPDHSTLDQLIIQMGLVGKRIAVEVNRELVPRSRYPDRCLSPDDRVEVIQAVGGG